MTNLDKHLEPREKLSAAIHESGHLVVLNAFGGFGRARIWRPCNRTQDIKTWIGRVEIFGDPEKIDYTPELINRLGIITPLPKHWRVCVGMAGVLAEGLKNGEDPFNTFYERHDAGELSISDLGMIGKNFNEQDIRNTVEILTNRWKDVLHNTNWILNAIQEPHPAQRQDSAQDQRYV